jgi:cyclopropane-fatty-acyl-phospholipid synthase
MNSRAELVAAHSHPDASAQAGLRILRRIFSGFQGSLAARLWDGTTFRAGSGPAAFTLAFQDPQVLRSLVLHRNSIDLADAYFRGRLEIEGDLYAALRLKAYFRDLHLDAAGRAALLLDALRLPARAARPGGGPGMLDAIAGAFSYRHSRASDRQAISYHYDLSNRFYSMWLDRQMVYSCAYFENPDDTLDQAQCHKLDLVCRKLRLAPGQRLLDVGCGWGALVCWAARHYGAIAHGITLSREQCEYARARIAAEGLEGRATVELRDYRDLPQERYDRVSSIGMFEHVGLARHGLYNAAVHRALRPGGLFLNHGITHDEEGWNRRSIETQFINRYVFPDGELDTVSNVQRGMERAGFEIHDVESLRPHYALTLRRWVQRLEDAHEEAVREVGEMAYRIWRLYMAGCALEFEDGSTGVYQILASRRGAPGAPVPVPLTRDDLYRRPASTLTPTLSRSAGEGERHRSDA